MNDTLDSMSMSNLIGVLFVDWKILISVSLFSSGQILYTALIVKYGFPLTSGRGTDIVDHDTIPSSIVGRT